jgi:DNA repair exonuclease SbcCD nuclease subunit
MQITNLAISQESDIVILAGDILDKQTNTSRAIQELMAGLRKLEENHIEVWFNQGQHEYQGVPWMGLDCSAEWLEHKVMKTTNNWNIAGSDYKNAEGLMEFLQSQKALEADILVCHQVWLDFMGELCKPQGSFADVPENVRYLITGDYHESICQKFGELTVISPGSSHLRSISEPQDKYVYSMELPDKGHKAKIVSLPLRTRRVINIKIEQNTEFKELAGQVEAHLELAAEYAAEFELAEHIAKPLMRLTLSQDDVEVSKRVTQLVADRAHLFYKQVKFVSPDSLDPKLNEHIDASERVGMLNCLDTYLDKKKQPATHALATRLLQAPDPDQALATWVKEQL